ncbi:MAG: transglutaminase domain-containing protein [Clostridium sp.]|uniref:transglutaminase domain-containing protein n=1 Tax=Clostridium sp. TaxID=1506 RepID=UPI002FCA7E46
MKRFSIFVVCLTIIFSMFTTNVNGTTISNKEVKIIVKKEKFYNSKNTRTLTVYTNDYNDFYRAVDNGIKNVEESIVLNISKSYIRGGIEEFKKVFLGIADLVATGSFIDSYTIYYDPTGSSNVYTVELNYGRPIDEVRRKSKEVDEAVNAITPKITSRNNTDRQNIRAIHDFIINNTAYNIDGVNNDTLEIEDHTAYGILIKQVGVCDGYAITMRKMLDTIGIENMVVIGTGDGVPHAWNLVKLSGKWFHVDSTWDDPIYYENGNQVQILGDEYFMRQDSFMKQTHNWETSKYPKTTGEVVSKLGIKYKRGVLVR